MGDRHAHLALYKTLLEPAMMHRVFSVLFTNRTEASVREPSAILQAMVLKCYF